MLLGSGKETPMFIRYLEVLLAVLVIVIVISQVIAPLWRNQPIFPFFGRKRKLERELTQVHGEQAEQALEKVIKSERRNGRKN
ncbi:MAG: hypothetical protein AAB472_01965 [Patescibacteria group bacterium]